MSGASTIVGRPYADQLETKYGKSYSVLVQFLRNEFYTIRRVDDSQRTKFYILDSCDSTLSSQVFTSAPVGEVDIEFIAVLQNLPPSSKTRLIIVQGGLLNATNGAEIDALSWHFRLDPLFLCTHLQRCQWRNEGGQVTRLAFPVALYSENKYITVVNTGSSHLTAQIRRDNGVATVIIMGFDYYENGKTTKLFEYLVDQGRFSAGSIDAADANPCDFVFHYVKKSLKQYALDLASHRSSRWEHYMKIYYNLLDSRDSIARYFGHHPKATDRKSSRLYAALDDYNHLIKAFKEKSSQEQKLAQYEVSTQAIAEARKSLEQADAVRRITIVGIVFIPLSFATSFFGMNFEQFGTGSLHIGYFFLVAVLSGIIAFLLAASIKPSERFWIRARRRLSEREANDSEMASLYGKPQVIWGWIRQALPFVNRLHELCSNEKWDLIEEQGLDDLDPGCMNVLRRVLRRLFRGAIKRLKIPFANFGRKDKVQSETDG